MARKPQTEQEKREDEVLKRMLNTPPKPHKPKGGKREEKDNDQSGSGVSSASR